MPTCIKHMQEYKIYEYCVYCGPPPKKNDKSNINGNKTVFIPTVFLPKENGDKDINYNCIVCNENHVGIPCPKVLPKSQNELCICGGVGCNSCEPRGSY